MKTIDVVVPQSLKAQQTAQTRRRICKAALKLFNDHGTSFVTTHDIAAVAEISSGNLYYHFKNKEEIIRELFDEMDIYSTEKWYSLGPVNPKVGIMDFMRFFVGNFANYRFFFREFATLLKADTVLAKSWQHVYEKLFRAMQESAERWVQAGILKPFASHQERDAFIENFWTIANFSAVHLDAVKGIKRKNEMEEHLRLLLHFLYPYHTAKGQRALELHY